MILVTNLFREKSENWKIYKPKTIISHFTKKRENELIKKKYAMRVVEDKEKVENQPNKSKKEK